MSKRIKTVLKLGIAIILGIIFGLIGNFFSFSSKDFIKDNILGNIQSIYIGIISYIAIPLLFLCLVISIYNMGDLKKIRKIGLRTILEMFVTMLELGIVTALICIPLFNLKFGQAGVSIKDTLQLFKNFIPNDILTPFINRSLLQVNILALVFGFTLLIIKEEAKWFVNLLQKINNFLIKILSYVCLFIPIYITISITKLIWDGKLNIFIDLGKFAIIYILMTIVYAFLMVLRTSIVVKKKPGYIFSKALPTFIVGLTTANSTLALKDNIKACEEGYGIKKEFTTFSIPLSMIIFKCAGMIFLTSLSCYFASIQGMEISVTWLISTVIISIILNIAVVPVPGGGVNNYAILFKELMLDPVGISVAIVLDSILEYVITGFNILGQMQENYVLAKRTHSLEEKKDEKINRN